jgi:dTDP-4-dehydrorhamnose reductase
MLGRAVCRVLRNKFEVYGLGKSKTISIRYIRCDIGSAKNLINAVSGIKPDILIHTAALSDVEYCENNPEQAYTVNTLGTKNIARACRINKAYLIYISTDYVFSGRKNRPYKETDKVCPVDIYGATKLEGERFVHNILDDYLIVRTSWLFGPGRDNFVTQILRRAKKEKEMKIIADKFGSPTYTIDLAHAIHDLILYFYANRTPLTANRQPLTANRQPLTANRILHVSNSGSCSRFEFTQRIINYAGIRGIKVKPVSFKDFGWSAKRPPYSVLDNSRFQKLMGYKLRPWQEALRNYIDTILQRR